VMMEQGAGINMIDPILICLYCGDTMDYPSEEWVEKFGLPDCCEEAMLQLERNKIFKIHKALGTLKASLEEEMLRGQL